MLFIPNCSCDRICIFPWSPILSLLWLCFVVVLFCHALYDFSEQGWFLQHIKDPSGNSGRGLYFHGFEPLEEHGEQYYRFCCLLNLVWTLGSNSTLARLWVAWKTQNILWFIREWILHTENNAKCSVAATFYQELLRNVSEVALLLGSGRAVANPFASLNSVAEWRSDNWSFL